jgi:hypothetical protein
MVLVWALMSASVLVYVSVTATNSVLASVSNRPRQ